jgi:hypothetical protein
MVPQQLSRLRFLATTAIVALLVASSAPCVFAQEDRGSSTVGDVFKGVVFDPTFTAILPEWIRRAERAVHDQRAAQ